MSNISLPISLPLTTANYRTKTLGQAFFTLSPTRMLSILISTLALLTAPALAEAQTNSRGGMLSFNLYPYLSDVDSDSAVTLAAASSLASGFSYFGFVNFYNQEDANAATETTTFFTEQNLRWRPDPQTPWELTFQANMRSGEDNDRFRFGARLHLQQLPLLKSIFDTIHVKWAVNFHALQIDDDPAHAWQIEHSYSASFPYLSDRLYLAGFIDQGINETLPGNLPKRPIVSETQFGYRLIEQLYLVAEYRINQYRRNDVNNLAVGLEYKMLW